MADEPRPPETKNDVAPREAGGSVPGGEPTARKEQSATEVASWHRLAGVGIEFIAAFGVCGWVGWLLDKKFSTSPWLLIAGCGLGFAVGLWSLIKAARKMMV